jgi:RHS repeat-associated protein
MKKYCSIISICGFLVNQNILGQELIVTSTTKNRIISETILTEIGSDEGAISSLNEEYRDAMIQYFDGLGRPIQNVHWRNTPNSHDFIQQTVYDPAGREKRTFLPFGGSSTTGEYNGLWRFEEEYFYRNALNVAHSNYFFGDKTFDNSPLNRILNQTSPGYSWQNHPVQYDFLSNMNTDVKRLIVTGDDISWTTGYYSENSLFKTEKKDENQHITREYKDKQGKIVLKESIPGENQKVKTYYVYDDFNDLRLVISPEGSAILETWTGSGILSEDFIDHWCYFYKYDERRRIVEKKVPGQEVIYTIYDLLDRPVLVQDGNLRNENKWKFFKYDILHRQIMTGLYTDEINIGRQSMQQFVTDNQVNNTYQLYERISASGIQGYTNTAFPPVDNALILTVTYYDDYSFNTDQQLLYVPESNPVFKLLVSYRTRGLTTGTRIRILQEQEAWLTSVTYYDKYNRPLQIRSCNHLDGYDITTNQYDFPGRLRYFKSTHQAFLSGANPEETTILKKYLYDHAGRMTKTKITINQQPEIILSSMKYNELGQLVEKNLHQTSSEGSPLQSVDYRYNIRGWLNRINQSNLKNINNFGHEIGAEEVVTKATLDTVFLTINDQEISGKTVINAGISDRKTLELSETENPEQKRYIQANEQINIDFLRDNPEDTLTFDAMLGYSGQDFTILFNGIEFEEGMDFAGMKDSIAQMVYDQLQLQGVVDTLVLQWFSDQSKAFFNERIGIVYFNDEASDLFGMEMLYDEGLQSLFAPPQYNGNVSGIKWQTKKEESDIQGYGFTYDNLSRMKDAVYGHAPYYMMPADPYHFDEHIEQYDLNGNIFLLRRDGYLGTVNGVHQYGVMDQLSYSYDGNRVTAVNDAVSGNTEPSNDFRDGNSSGSNEYAYDANGNMIRDDNKGIVSVQYNCLNLPVEIDFGSGKKILYLYDANGVKLRKTVENSPGYPVTTDYSGMFVYTDNSLDFFFPDEGKATRLDNLFRLDYAIKDHLGSIRVWFTDLENDGQPDMLQENHYYPFGLEMSGLMTTQTGPVDEYKYNGKELQPEHGLQWYDYGARFYDPQLGRWHTVDPLAEQSRRWSPYNYCMNNPIRFIDPDGMEMTDFLDKDGNKILHVEDGSNAVFQLTGNNKTDENFKFTGEYSDQGGKNEVSVEGAVAGAQDYVTNNYDKCNQSVNFVGRTYESATQAESKTVDNIGIVTGDSKAATINSDLASKVIPEKSASSAQESAAKGNLVVGASESHVVSMTTKTFDIIRYNTSGSVIEQKQIVGGQITNVNGSVRETNFGPGQKNSFQPVSWQKDLKWYSLPRK